MPLQIQPDESLPSYVRRNLHLNWRAGNMGIFEKLATRYVLKTIEVKGLAEAIGWPGCYGFNRLLQGHTMMAAIHVFKGHWDHSYSGKQYVSEGGLALTRNDPPGMLTQFELVPHERAGWSIDEWVSDG